MRSMNWLICWPTRANDRWGSRGDGSGLTAIDQMTNKKRKGGEKYTFGLFFIIQHPQIEKFQISLKRGGFPRKFGGKRQVIKRKRPEIFS